MTEIRQIGTGGTGRIHIHQTSAPVGIHVRLAVGGLHDDGIEALRVLTMRKKKRAIIEVNGMTAHDEGEVSRLKNGCGTLEPFFAE